MRVFIIKTDTDEAEEYVEEILRSIRTEPGITVNIPRKRTRVAVETESVAGASTAEPGPFLQPNE